MALRCVHVCRLFTVPVWLKLYRTTVEPNAGFTPISRDYTLRPRGFLSIRFGKCHGTVNNGYQRCRKVSYGARNWTRYIHDVSIGIKHIKSRQFLAHRPKCRDISSMPTADRCEQGIMPCGKSRTVRFWTALCSYAPRVIPVTQALVNYYILAGCIAVDGYLSESFHFFFKLKMHGCRHTRGNRGCIGQFVYLISRAGILRRALDYAVTLSISYIVPGNFI